ncbi:hypothetical protein G6011_04985 [Alternaria panax]|uniref:Rhodopsin domain-containing protein n=1 Tax=Alternaria panax TaxID=48097 RepID=A0AAD4FGG2_9PLEO|nr:hypothetical protein G6011_04985 [Alternaria panax]
MSPLQEVSHQNQPRELNNDTKQASLFAVGIPFIVITTMIVILRVYVRVRLMQLQLATEDYLMLSGAFFTISLSIANMICGWYGVGMHTVDIPDEDLTSMLKANIATRLLYVVAICLVKFGILVFYHRLDPRQRTRWMVYFLMVWVAALSIVTFFLLLFVCTPPSLFWDPVGQAKHPEKCLSQTTQQVFFNINGIMNSASTFKVLLKTYIPKIWSSAGSRENGSSKSRAQYDRSHTGQFEMRPFGGISNKSMSNRKYGVEGLTEIANESEEAIIQPENKMGMAVAISASSQ